MTTSLISDGSGFGTIAPTAPVNGVFNITGGKGLGPNNSILFHGFSTFNVGSGDVVDFNVSNTTTNILARISGGTPSQIDGTITSTIGAGTISGGHITNLSSANLFLLNPSGFIFTSGASINLGGSFLASTADAVMLNSDGTIFAVKPSGNQDVTLMNDTNLTAAPVMAFGFVKLNTGTISVTGATLSATELQFIVGPKAAATGDGLLISDSKLTATAGAIGLFAGNQNGSNSGATLTYTGGASGLPLSYATANLNNFSFSNTGVGVHLTGTSTGSSLMSSSASGAGGHVVIRGGVLTVDGGSQIVASNSGTATGGGIDLDAAAAFIGSATTGAGNVSTQNTGSGVGGAVTLNSAALTLAGTGSGISTSTTGTSGDAGSVTLNTVALPGSIALGSGTQILSYTSGSGDAGAVTVDATTLSIIGSGTQTPLNGTLAANSNGLLTFNTNLGTGIYSAQTSPSQTGSSGAVSVSATGAASLSSDGQIASVSGSSSAVAGTLAVTSGTSATGTLSLASGAQIASVTAGSQNAADLTVSSEDTTASALTIAGTNSAIFSQAASGAIGAAGQVNVASSGGLGLGTAGMIASNSDGLGGATGASLVITSAGQISLASGAQILTESSGAQGAASLTVNANATDAGTTAAPVYSLKIDGAGTVSGIYSQLNNGATNPGAIVINSAGTVALSNGAAISSPSSITLGGTDFSHPKVVSLSLASGSTVNETGGSAVVVNASGSVLVTGTNSAVEANNGGTINIQAAAAAGNKTTKVDAISVTNNGTISTSTGSLQITASSSDNTGILNLDSGGTIKSVISGSGSGSSAGFIDVTAGEIDIGSEAGAGGIHGTSETPSGFATSVFTLSNTGIFSLSENGATGSAGSVFVETTGGNITLSYGGQIGSAAITGSTGDSSYVYLLMDAGTLTVGGFNPASTSAGPTPMIYSIGSGSGTNFKFVAVEPFQSDTLPTVNIQNGASIATATVDGLGGNIYLDVGGLSLYQNSSVEADVDQPSTDTSLSGAAGDIFFATKTLTMAGDTADSDQSYIQSGFIVTGGAYNPNTKSTTLVYNPFNTTTPVQGYVTGTYTAPSFIEGGSYTGTAYSDSNGKTGLNAVPNVDLTPIGVSTIAPNGTNYAPDNYVRVDFNGAINPAGPIPNISTQPFTGYNPGNGLVLDGSTTSSTVLPSGGTIPSLSSTVNLPMGPLQLPPTYLVYNDYGLSVGGNLFISFKTFNLNQGEVAVFDAQEDANGTAVSSAVNNIIIRVTSLNTTPTASTIDGTIEEYDGSMSEQSSLGIASGIQATKANIFFVNPNGIIFKQNGAVTLNGGADLTLSTADYVGFSSNFDPNFDSANPDDTQVFYTTTNANDGTTIDAPGLSASSALGSAAPTAYGFASDSSFGASNSTKSVLILGSKINLLGTGSVSVIAGNISLGRGQPDPASPPISIAGTVVESINNQILFFSAGSAGNLTFTTPSAAAPTGLAFSGATLGNVDLDEQSVLHVKGGDSTQASIVVDANNFTLNNSLIVDEADASPANSGATGGSVTIAATGTATISSSNGFPSFISTSNFGYGQGGSVEIDAPTLNITVAGGENNLTGIFSAAQPIQYYLNSSSGNLSLGTFAYDTSTTGPDGLAVESGAAGNITLNIGSSLTMTGGLISAATAGEGAAGTILVQGQLAGNPVVRSNPLISISEGGEITSSTNLTNPYFSKTGDAGTIKIYSGSLTIDGSGLAQTTGISGISASAGAQGDSDTAKTGDGGDVLISMVGDLTIQDGGQISASSYTKGACGFVSVTQSGGDGQAITIDGNVNVAEMQATGILAENFGTGGLDVNDPLNPNGLAINVSAVGAVKISTGGEISSATFDNNTTKSGGKLVLAITTDPTAGSTPGSLTIDGTGNPSVFDQYGDFQSTGVISSSYGGGRAGDLSVTVGGNVTIEGGGAISDGSFFGTGGGGNLSVTINSGSLTIDGTYTDGSNTVSPIFGNQGFYTPTGIDAATYLGGSGGNVTVTLTGTGNDVSLKAGGQISSASIAGGTSGSVTVSINSGSLTIDGTNTPGVPNSFFSSSLFPTGILSSTYYGEFNPQICNAGDTTVTITNGSVMILAGGQISSGTFDGPSNFAGHGGNVSLTVDSGDLTVDGTSAPTGIATGIFSSSQNGSVSDYAGDAFVTVSGFVSIKGAGQISSATNDDGHGGTVLVSAGSLGIDGMGSAISSSSSEATTTAGAGGDVNLSVAGAITISNNAVVSATTNGGQGLTAGSGGNINIGVVSTSPDLVTANLENLTTPTSLTLSGAGSEITSDTSGLGLAGKIDADIAGPVAISGGAQISSGATDLGRGTGDGGTVTLLAHSLTINGQGAGANPTGIFSSTLLPTTNSAGSMEGDAGTVSLTVTGPVSLSAGGEISSSSTSSGNAGTVSLTADSLTIGGTATAVSAISTSSAGPSGATGSGGAINLSITGPINLGSYGKIEATTATGQLGGSINVGGTSSLSTVANPITQASASSLTLAGAGSAITASTSGAGPAGNISLALAGGVSITTGGQISSSSSGDGTAGTVTLNAASLAISHALAGSLTGISTSSTGPSGATGLGGTITVTVPGSISIGSGGQIAATTATGQTGGDINIFQLSGAHGPSGDLTLADEGTLITAAATGTGDGGNILLTTDGTLNVDDRATITCSSLISNAGTLTINAQNLKMLRGGAIDTTAAAIASSASSTVGNGGNVKIKVAGEVYLLDSRIVTDAGNQGGNITVDPQFVILDSSLISASGKFGDGDINIATTFLLDSDSTIIATGSVSLNTVPLDFSGSLIALPGQLADAEKQLRESCARSVNHEFSSLIVVGRGGTESAPEELQADSGTDDALPQKSAQ